MKYSYDKIAEAKAIADEKISELLEPILEQFDTEINKIVSEFCACYCFKNREEETKLIEKFIEINNKKNNSEYSEYIDIYNEIDDGFFFIHYNIYRLRFANEQRKKIIQNITIEL